MLCKVVTPASLLVQDEEDTSRQAPGSFMQGKGPQGLRALSMAGSEVSNPNFVGAHMVVRLAPGIAKVHSLRLPAVGVCMCEMSSHVD